MAVDARLSSLGERHKHLESLIDDEMRRPVADENRLHSLKRQKLAIKDEMYSLGGRNRRS
ncbi:MAG: DUF465 domain-containing protein [Parvularcula sp.]|jgi:hypothetical protein|nr:DUF465 domain-containing protein [Parvularcula sp.]